MLPSADAHVFSPTSTCGSRDAVVPSAAAGAEAAHAHAVEVQEQRQLKHEETLVLHKNKHVRRDHGKATVVAATNPAAATITVGTPVPDHVFRVLGHDRDPHPLADRCPGCE